MWIFTFAKLWLRNPAAVQISSPAAKYLAAVNKTLDLILFILMDFWSLQDCRFGMYFNYRKM